MIYALNRHKVIRLLSLIIISYQGLAIDVLSAEKNNLTGDLIKEQPALIAAPSDPLLHSDETEQKQHQSPDDPQMNIAEQSKDTIYQGAVDFANWVDKFFGERQELDDANYDYLRLVNNLEILEGENPKYHPRIRAKVHLPQFSKRTSLLFSNKRASSNDNFEFEENQNSPLIQDDQDEEKLSAAINYESDVYKESKFDFRLGIDSSLELFSFIKLSQPLYESDDLEINNFNFLFWEEDEGFGLATQFEVNKVLDENNLFRWKYAIRRSEKSDGNEWNNLFSLVNRLSEDDWIAYEFRINGDTEHTYDVENYRLSIRLRKRTAVHWLYFELEPEVRYIRTPESLEREMVPGITLRLEVQFEKN